MPSLRPAKCPQSVRLFAIAILARSGWSLHRRNRNGNEAMLALALILAVVPKQASENLETVLLRVGSADLSFSPQQLRISRPPAYSRPACLWRPPLLCTKTK